MHYLHVLYASWMNLRNTVEEKKNQSSGCIGWWGDWLERGHEIFLAWEWIIETHWIEHLGSVHDISVNFTIK